MQAVEYMGRVLPDGHLEIPATAMQELQLEPDMQVKVILLRATESRMDPEQVRERRLEIWRKVDEIRQELSGMNFSLTDSLIQARQEEDDAL